MKARDFLWAKFVWNMFDFAVDSRNEGDTPGRNDKGLVTYDRKTQEGCVLLVQGQLVERRRSSTSPAAASTRARRATVDVKVYSNMDSVRLQVNGTSYAPTAGADHIFQWTNVALGTGANTITATGTSGTTTQTDTVSWTRN